MSPKKVAVWLSVLPVVVEEEALAAAAAGCVGAGRNVNLRRQAHESLALAVARTSRRTSWPGCWAAGARPRRGDCGRRCRRATSNALLHRCVGSQCQGAAGCRSLPQPQRQRADQCCRSHPLFAAPAVRGAGAQVLLVQQVAGHAPCTTHTFTCAFMRTISESLYLGLPPTDVQSRFAPSSPKSKAAFPMREGGLAVGAGPVDVRLVSVRPVDRPT